MKLNEKKIVLIFIVMFLFMIFDTFFYRIFSYLNLSFILFWLISTLLLFLLIGHKKDRYVYKVDAIQITIIYCFTYFIFIYLSGLFLGFVRNPYSLEIIKILRNIIPVIIFIFIQETFRFTIVKKTNSKIIFSLLFILFVGFDIETHIYLYNFKNSLDIFEMIGTLIVPSIIKNLLFIYVAYKGSIWPNIIYRLIFELYVYIIPIIPDLGIYFESVFGLAFPTILFLKFNSMFAKKSVFVNKKKRMVGYLITLPFITVLILIVALSSNIFSHSIISIGSNSMLPKISKGDVVIVEKLNKDFEKIKIGDILVYSNDKKIVVHRVVEINNVKNKYVFKTKGDNNKSVDNYIIEEANIIGKVNLIVPYIGYPSVWLSEKLVK